MKMLTKSLMIAAVVSTLASCGSNEAKKIGTAGETASAEAPKSESHVFKVNDVIQLGDYVITITKFIDNAPSPDEFTKPEEGKKFVAAEVLYENTTGDKQLDYNPFDWKLIDGDSYSYEIDIMNSAKEPSLHAGTLNTGQKARGWVNFQIPKEARELKLQFTPNWLSNENVVVQLY